MPSPKKSVPSSIVPTTSTTSSGSSSTQKSAVPSATVGSSETSSTTPPSLASSKPSTNMRLADTNTAGPALHASHHSSHLKNDKYRRQCPHRKHCRLCSHIQA